MAENLERLAELIQIKNDADHAIAQLIGRPCEPGNIGEFVAAHVFGIRLMRSGSHPGHDGIFQGGPLAGKTVNIKANRRHESALDIASHPSDFYLVLTGPPGQARSLPWVERDQLLADLGQRGVKIGTASSVRKADWEAARIFPPGPAAPLQLSERQLAWLRLFSPAPAR